MRAQHLLRLYPAWWRARYGDEFLEVAGDRPLTAWHIVDVVLGAIDARLTGDVRRAAMTSGANGGTAMVKSLSCAAQPRISTRDALVGAGVMIVATLIFTWAGFAARAAGRDDAATIILGMSFPVALTVSMPFWLMTGVSRRTQLVIVGATLTILLGIGAAQL